MVYFGLKMTKIFSFFNSFQLMIERVVTIGKNQAPRKSFNVLFICLHNIFVGFDWWSMHQCMSSGYQLQVPLTYWLQDQGGQVS